jgi:hypothetical protein
MIKQTISKEALKEGKMHKFVDDSILPPIKDSIVEGTVIAIAKNSIFVDLPPWGTGIIFGRE